MFGRAHESRQICEYPKSYKDETPYFNFDFSITTENICRENLDSCGASLRSSKVIILGDVSVGKTSIVNRFCHQIFDAAYKATIGVDFQVERFDILNVPFHLQIWDTAGQERFRSIAQSYYRSSHGVIIVFDFTHIVTLSNCKNWLRDALNATGNGNAFIFLVGTKKDLVSPATFDNIETSAMKIARKLNAEYWAVSSRTNDNINELFFRIAALMFEDCLTKEREEVNVIFKQDLLLRRVRLRRKRPTVRGLVVKICNSIFG